MSSFVDDLRAAGWGAPVRAGYEMAKRAGGHRLVLGRLARSGATASPPPLRPVFGTPDTIPASAQERTLDEAARIAAGTVTVFERDLDIGDLPDWHAVIDGPGAWARVPWWELDLRSPTRPGDVKWVWQLGRHRHLVVLARAVHLRGDDARWVAALDRHLRSWLDANPLEIGVHWASNLELALRSVAWLEVLGLAGPSLDPAVRAAMVRVLWHTGRHLLVELPYTLSTMANNHLLGDALGLVVLGHAFDHPTARRWRRIGDRLLARQADREFRPDGSTIDEALSYQRFVTEMLAVRLALPDPPPRLRDHLERSAQYLARLGVLDGLVPPYGDWDEGRVLVSSVAPDAADDLRGTTLLGLALAGSGARAADRERHDELAWYASEGEPVDAEAAVTAGPVGGGIARAETDGLVVWLRAGERAWHGHADLTSVEVADGGEWIVADPGTGTYNGDPAMRDGFRSSRAHTVLRLDEVDQLEPYRVFRWRHTARAHLGPTLVTDEVIVLWAVHDAYRRLVPPRRVLRVAILERDRTSVVVADWAEGAPGVRYALTLPFDAGANWEPAAQPTRGTVSLPSGRQWHVALPAGAAAHRGSREPWIGWWSATYGSATPATALEATGTVAGPVLWQLGADDPIRWHVDGDALVGDGGRRVTVTWAGSVVRVHVSQGRRQWSATAPVRTR